MAADQGFARSLSPGRGKRAGSTFPSAPSRSAEPLPQTEPPTRPRAAKARDSRALHHPDDRENRNDCCGWAFPRDGGM